MTITINLTIFYCWLTIAVFEAVYTYISWLKFKKALKQQEFAKMVVEAYKQSPSFKLMVRIIFNPISCVILFSLFVIVSPLSFIWTIFGLSKKVIGYKSKLQKESEAELAAIEKAKKHSEDFMKNEGRGIDYEQPQVYIHKPD